MTDTVIQKALNKVNILFKDNDPSHDIDHVKRVHKLALWIASDAIIFSADGKNTINNPSINMLRLELCAILHDVGDHKYLKEGETTIELLKNTLEEIDVPVALHDALIEDIISIGWSYQKRTGLKPKSWEAKIVQDADRLDALGAIGIARVFSFGAVKNRPIIKPNLDVAFPNFCEPNSSINEVCTLDHLRTKLLYLKDHMNILKGYNEAISRHNFMVQFMNQILIETLISL